MSLRKRKVEALQVRRANALVALDDGHSVQMVSRIFYLDRDTVRGWLCCRYAGELRPGGGCVAPCGFWRWHLIAEWLIHKMFGKWDALLEANSERTNNPYRDGMLAYVQGSAHANSGNMDQAKQSLATLRSLMTDKSFSVTRFAINPRSALLEIAAFGLEGEIKQAAGDLNGAIAAFKEAVKKEDSLQYMEPPVGPCPCVITSVMSSKAQAKMQAIGNPTMRRTRTNPLNQAGRMTIGEMTETNCRISQATTR